MLFRKFFDRDTSITDAFMDPKPYRQGRSTRATGSNLGRSEIIDVFYRTGSQGEERARALVYLNHQPFQDLIDDELLPSTGIGVKYFLKMTDAPHGNQQAEQFTLKVFPVSSSAGSSKIWVEGAGFDNDTLGDPGVANWGTASTTLDWVADGGDYYTSNPGDPDYYGSGSQFFDIGNENLEIDVTEIVNNWLSGNIPNNGLLLKITASQEAANSTSLYMKKFHSRTTHFLDRRPYVEARFETNIRDQRDDFLFDESSTVYGYNIVRGQLTNLATGSVLKDVKVQLKDALNGQHVAFFTGSYVRPGVYNWQTTMTSSAIRSATTGNILHEVWFSGSHGLLAPDPSATLFFTGSAFTGSIENFTATINPVEYALEATNMRKWYGAAEYARINIIARQDNWKPSVQSTGSAGIKNNYLEKAYWRIKEADSGTIIVPFYTGSSEEYTKLSYDGATNFLELHMSMLIPGNAYRIEFLLDENGYRRILKDSFVFKVSD